MGRDTSSRPAALIYGRRKVSIRSISLAAVLSLCAAPAEAATATWQFVESNDGAPGIIGATLTLNSPPVDLSPGVAWTATTADLVDFRILDPGLGPVGPYDLSLNVASILEGIGPDFVNIHEISGQDASGDVAFSNIDGSPGVSDLGVALASGGFNDVSGDWVLVTSSVPEPSAMAMAGTAVLAGVGVWARRRRACR
jgi:hypothetical protein